MALSIPGPRWWGHLERGGQQRPTESGKVRLAGVGATGEDGRLVAGRRESPADHKAQSTLSETITRPGAEVLKGWSLVSGQAASPRSLSEMQILRPHLRV